MMKFNLMQGDCLERMKEIPDGSVDAIIADPPYGTVDCRWDNIIPFDLMWQQLNRIIKPDGVIALFGAEPFTSTLVCSNLKAFKYRLTWDKVSKGNFLNAKKQPLRQVEDIAIFYTEQPTYNPAMVIRGKVRNKGGYNKGGRDSAYSDMGNVKARNNTYYPTDLIQFSNAVQIGKVHPTQKPVALMEYLIKTYTNEGETVLDFTMGSGSTGVAAKNLNRDFIGIEMDKGYFDIAKQRIESAEVRA